MKKCLHLKRQRRKKRRVPAQAPRPALFEWMKGRPRPVGKSDLAGALKQAFHDSAPGRSALASATMKLARWAAGGGK